MPTHYNKTNLKPPSQTYSKPYSSKGKTANTSAEKPYGYEEQTMQEYPYTTKEDQEKKNQDRWPIPEILRPYTLRRS
jgi:hypothetical protein|tara:strand:+ start:250 stop:480 length:231 start_codon:yes stop_codon:yes gene_type:complete